MPWSKLPDEQPDHPAIRRLLEEPDLTAALAAYGIYSLGLSEIAKLSAQGDRSGWIGRRRITAMIGQDPQQLADLLVKYGLWADAENGWIYVDAEKHLPLPRDPEVQRRNGAKGAAKTNAIRWGKNRQVADPVADKVADKPSATSRPVADRMSAKKSAKSVGETVGEKSARATGTGTGVVSSSSRGGSASKTAARSSSQPATKQQALIEGGESKPETPAGRARLLAQHWMELVPLSNFPAVQQIVRKAIGADYDDERISSALDTLAAEGRSLTTETLRVALDGPPAVSRNGHRPYKNPPASAYTES